MNVIYSIAAKFGGGGIGTTSCYAVRGIARHKYLKKLFCDTVAKTEIDPKLIHLTHASFLEKIPLIPQNFQYLVKDRLHDFLVSQRLSKCDIFHSWNGHCLYSLKKAKKQGAVTVVERASSHILTQNKLVSSEYQRWGVKDKPISSRIIKRCLAEFEEADYITVPSDFAYQSMVENGIPEEKLILIPFGVDVEKFQTPRPPRYAKRCGQASIKPQASSIFTVLFVGEVSLRKGIPYLLQAWSKLNLKDAELWLVGEIKSDIKKVLLKYRNRSDTKPLGFRKDVPELMNQASIFVFPSIEEGSALVTYEALAAGLPIVTTFNSGSVVKDGKEGFVVPIRNVETLAEKILFLYNNKGTRQRMSIAAKMRAKQFTWYNYGENLVATYKKILSR